MTSNSHSEDRVGFPQAAETYLFLPYSNLGKQKFLTFDFGKFAFKRLAQLLGEEWQWHSYSANHSKRTARSYLHSMERFLTFLESKTQDSDLDLVESDRTIAVAFHQWEVSLSQQYEHRSLTRRIPNQFITLLRFRVQNGRPLGKILTQRIESGATYGSRHTDKHMEAFSKEDIQKVIKYAKSDIRHVKKRILEQDWLGEAGFLQDHGKKHLSQFLHLAHRGTLTRDHFYSYYSGVREDVDQEILDWARSFDTNVSPKIHRFWENLVNCTFRKVSLNILDVTPFFILMCYYTGLSSGELKSMRLSTMTLSPDKISFTVLKSRAGSERNIEIAKRESPTTFNVLKDYVEITAPIRKEIQNPALKDQFWIQHRAHYGNRSVRFALFSDGGNLRDWSNQHNLQLQGPFNFDRLRKTHKSVVADSPAKSTLSKLDHSEEVSIKHYISTEQLLQRSARVIRTAQQDTFNSLVIAGPTAVPEPRAQVSHIPNLADSTSPIDRAVQVGHCSLQNNETWVENGDCRMPITRCMVCSNAIVFTEHLPQVLLLETRLQELRTTLSPEDFFTLYGSSLENIKTIKEAFGQSALDDAYRKIQNSEEFLLIPLEMRQ